MYFTQAIPQAETKQCLNIQQSAVSRLLKKAYEARSGIGRNK